MVNYACVFDCEHVSVRLCVGLGECGMRAWLKVAEQNHMEAPKCTILSSVPIESKLGQVGNYKDRI